MTHTRKESPLTNDKDTTSGEVAATLLITLVVIPLLFAGGIAWGIQPLAESFGVTVPFWPAFFTALLIRLAFRTGVKPNRQQS